MLYVFVACTVASVCLFVRAFIVDMVEDKMLSRFFLLLGIAMLMVGMGVTASLWSLPFLAVIPVSVIVYWHTRWRAKGSTNLRRLAVCSLAYDVAVDVCVVMLIVAVAFSIMQK